MKIDRSGEPEPLVGGLTFDELVDRHWESVYRLVYHLCGKLHDAQDLAQESFLRAMSARGSFKVGTNLRAWLLRIASNAFLDQRRRHKTARATTMKSEPAITHRDAAADDETMRSIQDAIGKLEETQRAVFVLRTQEDLSFREIADVLDTTEETARWHMMQARRKLMKELDGKV